MARGLSPGTISLAGFELWYDVGNHYAVRFPSARAAMEELRGGLADFDEYDAGDRLIAPVIKSCDFTLNFG